jgi:hypothetical protein
MSDFWEATPGELFVYAEGYERRALREAAAATDNAVICAYLASRFVWAKRLKKLDHYLSRRNEEQSGKTGKAGKITLSSDEEMKMFARALAAAQEAEGGDTSDEI